MGLLVTNGPGGLIANPIPFLLDAERGAHGTLIAHMARANPQWREADGCREALVVFQDVDSYITPAWYATKRETGKVVPTWNYATVHAYGPLRAIDDAGWLHDQVGRLTDTHEASRKHPVGGDRRAGGFRRHAIARHRRDRDPDRAHRRQMEGQPEPA